jgi:hypothetical protein
MPLGPELIEAYRRALYVVYGEPELVIRVGEPNAELDALLEAKGAATAAFVTAANPRGRLAGKTENELAAAALHQSQADVGYACHSGEGRDPRGEWPAEPSLLVAGIPRAGAEALGRAFGQNAIVFVEKGKAPELVILAAG